MESVFTELSCGFHGGLQDVRNAIVGMRGLEIGAKVTIQWVLTQPKLVCFQNGRDAVFAEEARSLSSGAVISFHILQNRGSDVLFSLRWRVLLWVTPRVGAVAPMPATPSELVWIHGTTRATRVVLLECVVAVVANIKINLFGTVLNLQRQKPAWITLTLTTTIDFVTWLAARNQHLRGTVVRGQSGWPSMQIMIRNACVIKGTTYDGMRKFFCSALSGRLVVLDTCHMS